MPNTQIRGYDFWFEIYLLNDNLTESDWKSLYNAVCQFARLSKFEIVCVSSDNVVRYFIGSNKNLESLSNNIQGFLLRRSDASDFNVPENTTKEGFIRFVTDGNWLDLKEKYAVKKAKDLQIIVFRIRAINMEKALTRGYLYFQSSSKQWSLATKLFSFFPAKLLAVDFKTNTKYLHKTVPRYLNIEKSLHMLVSDNLNALFEVDTFPYFSHNYYLNLTNYEFDKHSFIVGASGSGKSKLISLIVDRLAMTSLKMNYRVIVVDPHASLADDFAHINDKSIITFGKQDSTELFPGAGTDLTAATELTATLFKSLLAEQFNPRLDRLLRYTLFALMTAQTMSLENLKRFLTDVEYRIQIIEHVQAYIPVNIVKFFGGDFNEFRTQYYNETILPLVSLVDEMQLQPSLMGQNDSSLVKTIQDNFLTVFSLNKVSMGDKVVKTVAGLLIQQIFLLAQSRVFGQKIILIIDEVSVVQNPTIAQILAEARKFNLTVILTQQYFGQVDKDLRDAIFANVYNYYTFKVSEEDARALEGNLNIELPKETVEAEHAKGIKETDIKVKIMTELHPRECLVRLMSNGQMTPALKVRTVDAPTSATTIEAPKLKTILPEKFIEGHKIADKPVMFSKEFIEKLSEDAISTNAGPPGIPSKRPSIRELLSEHSSSRAKVNKTRKNNDQP